MTNFTPRAVIVAAAITVSIVVLVGGCATQPEVAAYDPPGFFSALIHGYLIVFGFLGSIFMDVRMYAFPNSGVMYDFGYLIGILGFLITLVSMADQ